MPEQDAALAAPQTPATPNAPAPAASTPAPAEAAPEASQKPQAESAAAPEKGQDKPSTPDQAEKTGQSRFQRRIDRAYRAKAEAEAKAAFLEKQLNERMAKEQPQADPDAPRLEKFDDIEKYAEA